jgi:hypothetical protein
MQWVLLLLLLSCRAGTTFFSRIPTVQKQCLPSNECDLHVWQNGDIKPEEVIVWASYFHTLHYSGSMALNSLSIHRNNLDQSVQCNISVTKIHIITDGIPASTAPQYLNQETQMLVLWTTLSRVWTFVLGELACNCSVVSSSYWEYLAYFPLS